jgi:endonuclease YncB( thermonuclease family)
MLRTIILCSLIALVAHADPFGDYKVTRVVDGDTIRVDGLDNSLRLLGIDTEETFKHKAERDAYAAGWASYVTNVRGTSPHPVKFATPLGEDAKVFAEHWFADVDVVRLERDDPQEIRDRYHRYLAYVLAKKAGKWVCYNVEAVRAGMSPYFPKYGRSRRYHAEFVAAEAEAKAAHRGIWAANARIPTIPSARRGGPRAATSSSSFARTRRPTRTPTRWLGSKRSSASRSSCSAPSTKSMSITSRA